MSSQNGNNNSRLVIISCQWWLIMILIFDSACSQKVFKSRSVFSSPGTQFSPANAPAQLLSMTFTDSLKKCAIACNLNVLCRIFDYGVNVPQQCRLFEGDINTMGTIIPSPSPDSMVGTIRLSSDLFIDYGKACSTVTQQSRYLTCSSNSTIQCVPHTYWNGSMCVAQSPVLGSPCEQNIHMCREDLNYTCLQFNQCGPLSILSGTTIVDRNTVIAGSSSLGFTFPAGILVDTPSVGSVIVTDGVKNQVVQLWDVSSGTRNASVMIRNWTTGNTFNSPYDIFFNSKNGNNLYVSDAFNNRVILFYAMQSTTPTPKIVAGLGGSGTGMNQLNTPSGLVIDRHNNMIIADYHNNRVMLYAPNATYGTMIIGTGAAGNNSYSLQNPAALFLDEFNSWLYVVDSTNNRIQRFSMNSSLPLNGTTVAGGNGHGPASNQLYSPYGIWVSNKTGALYIADGFNNRIQRWSQGASAGVTIAGSLNGTPGTNATMLQMPYRLAVNTNETFMYVSDGSNARVQRFQLI